MGLTNTQRQVMRQFIESASSGILPSGLEAPLDPLPIRFWERWNTPNDLLQARGPIGSPRGVSPATPNDRVMECFGSTRNRFPLMSVDRQINGPKGRIMDRSAATSLEEIRMLANRAARQDTEDAANTLLQSIRSVSWSGLYRQLGLHDSLMLLGVRGFRVPQSSTDSPSTSRSVPPGGAPIQLYRE